MSKAPSLCASLKIVMNIPPCRTKGDHGNRRSTSPSTSSKSPSRGQRGTDQRRDLLLSSNMPPRPRPRPKSRTTAANQPSTSSEAAPITLTTEEDEDNLFLRNKNLTTQTWKQLNKRSEEVVVLDPDSNDEDSARKNRKRTAQSNPLPSWTLPQARAKLDATEIIGSGFDDLYADDSDEDATSRAKRLKDSPTKDKRGRSRSQSITPPPELTFAQKQTAKLIVRNTLGISISRSRSPSDKPLEVEDDSSDIEFSMGPEESQIYPHSLSRNISTSDNEGPTVSIKVHWKPHPLNKLGVPHVWDYTVKRNNTLRQIFDETADSTQTLVDDLVLIYKGRRIYSSVSPRGLDIWTEGELDACDKTTYEYMRANNIRFTTINVHSPSPALVAAGTTSDCGDGDSDSDFDDMSQGPADTFKLTLRSAKTPKDIILTVRPSTKCGAIVKAFLRKAGLADKYLEVDPNATSSKNSKRGRKSMVVVAAGPNLMVDGDKMSNDDEILVAELEDGDMVEVVGL